MISKSANRLPYRLRSDRRLQPGHQRSVFAWAGATWPIALYLMGIGCISAISLWFGRRFVAQTAEDKPVLALASQVQS